VSIGDQAGLKAVDKLTAETLPKLEQLLHTVLEGLLEIVDRLDGAVVTITVKLPAKTNPTH
jgi:hypothetical protein